MPNDKVMSVEEILKIEFTGLIAYKKFGDYHFALRFLFWQLKKQIDFGYPVEHADNQYICIAFTDLYALAQGEYVSKVDVIEKLSHNTFTPDCKWFLKKMVGELPTIGTEGK